MDGDEPKMLRVLEKKFQVKKIRFYIGLALKTVLKSSPREDSGKLNRARRGLIDTKHKTVPTLKKIES